MPELVVRHPEALWRCTLERIVVLAPGETEPRTLEPPGDAIWELLANPTSIDDLVAELAAAFSAPPEVVRTDVERFLDDLLANGLVARVDVK